MISSRLLALTSATLYFFSTIAAPIQVYPEDPASGDYTMTLSYPSHITQRAPCGGVGEPSCDSIPTTTLLSRLSMEKAYVSTRGCGGPGEPSCD
ncbi:hypothetical protein SISNIDRAFT_38441 [Sistotremastrum niveocremeum HHB9708]|uniref:Uncharacterized protein n=2 Tax=Sistotremastraceae TaxID=3402574 RepID=A0A164VPH3_9AGAM|nr:hypothetical protein SISNIDRAFT_38441 [Sistotremastrum niveocremeum HHB9708]KZT37921.1 hypothetical protein SISSUDRAFT_807760 [Sistotremastrum suecicum HHB10207 ss-3]